jgi:Fe-coproporphyrin III synthase
VTSLIRIHSAESTARPVEGHALKALPILVVHAHSSCNCRCVMCDIWKNREGRSVGEKDLGAQLDSIRALGVKWLVFSGGEPLMNTELPALCAMLRKEKIRLTLLTTGLLLDKKAEEVAGGFDEIMVSLDGPREIHDKIRRVPGGFDLIRRGVAAVRRLRPEIHISARTTVQKANHAQLCEAVIAAQGLELNGISFLAADLTSEAFHRENRWSEARQSEVGLSTAELDVLSFEIETLISEFADEIRTGFVAESPEKLRRIARHFRAHLGLDPDVAPMCNAPWVSAVVETDGTVRPCFFHGAIGNLREGTLEQVLNSPKARAFRAGLNVAENPVCKRCVCSLNYRP